jgi:coenzyme Q-binding protein COQ10
LKPVSKTCQVPAPPQLVYDTVTDYERYPEFFSEFREVTVLDREGDALIVDFSANYGKLVSYTLRIEHDPGALTTRWSYVGGDLKDSQGGWRFSDDGSGQTHIDYEVSIRVGFFVPKMVSDRLIAQGVPAMFTQLKTEVARRLEASR